jgi:predicted phosphodiesterase
MKIAVIADIHGNFQALETVLDHLERWNPDHVLVLGDIVNRGPRSKECLNIIQEKGEHFDWLIMKGNHEGYVLNFLDPTFSRTGPEFDMREVIFWTYQSLSPLDLDYLENLPEMLPLDLDNGQKVRGYHASTAGDRIGIYPQTSNKEFEEKVDTEADLFLVGHTHQPLIKCYNNTIICNVGSVGLPFDGDKRAAYGQFTYSRGTWEGKIVRVEYDLSAASNDYYETGFIPTGGPMAELILAELKLGWPQLSVWFQRYENAVLAGEISLIKAVESFLLNPSIEEIRTDIPMRYP